MSKSQRNRNDNDPSSKSSRKNFRDPYQRREEKTLMEILNIQAELSGITSTKNIKKVPQRQ